MGHLREHRDIKLVTTDKRRNQLVSEPNYNKMVFRRFDSNWTEENKNKNEEASIIMLVNIRN